MNRFTPEYYLIRDGNIEQVSKDEYRNVSRINSDDHNLFADNEKQGFVARSIEERKERIALFRRWIKNGLGR